jgi:hypothetical protein
LDQRKEKTEKDKKWKGKIDSEKRNAQGKANP